ncbi:zinc-dependent alcohol dehydrogenase [Dictyobacter kobayashii]|uniref:Alcohol dehydrogenase n=1 Tax=Dictyobacter kobayashii TaxID=2014872 RepID=A0A402ANS2_9CHLR|nr:zinc-binding alcohol dehydrogenase [Dictyobacter kobayashii]GCE20851.1 alcohol dehydrogenase [Dictyobacter kobayashii]
MTERLDLVAPRSLTWITEELPSLGPHDVLVKTLTAAISIGSELPVYGGTSRAVHPPQYPRSMGYESVGIVVACGFAVQRVQCGDRVVAFYGHYTHAVVPETRVIVVPDGISDALAILSILTCDTAKGVRKLSPRPEEKILITGAGAIGLLTLFIVRAYGVAQVDVVEPLAARHSLARLLGARNVWHPQDVPIESRAYAVAFECSSQNKAFALLQKQVQQQGRICITADGNIEPFVLTPDFHEKELQIIGSSDGWDYHQHAAWYFREVQRHPTHLEQLFELRIARDELISTFEQLAKGGMHPIKVLVSYNHIPDVSDTI